MRRAAGRALHKRMDRIPTPVDLSDVEVTRNAELRAHFLQVFSLNRFVLQT